MFKNVATKIALFAFDTTSGAPKTGDAANLTAYVAKDYSLVTALADTSATEMDATNAKGWYLFDVTQAETNADALLFTAKSATANISVVGQPIFTTPNRFTTLAIDASGLADANAVKVGPTGAGTAQTARDLAATLGVAGAGLTALPLTAANFATDTLAAAAASAGFANKLADHFWRRTFANAKASANGDAKAWRSGLGVMAKLVNKVALAAGILTAYEEDDATALGTQTATTDASADPVTGLDTV